MNKEINISPTEVQKKLWGKFLTNGITSRINDAREGHLPTGLTLAEMTGDQGRFAALLGEFAPRVLIASNPNNPMSLLPEQVAVAGGWCALRTNDVKNLTAKDPIIANPLTGELEPVTSVEQVADWMEKSVSFDQIVESIGAVNASEYGVISEQRLWTERITAKLSQIFRGISSQEQEKIAQAVANAEQMRAEMTSRYLQYVTGNEDISFKRIVDDDIWDDLRYAQVDTFSRIGLSVEKLQRMFPDEAETTKSKSLIWSMYSEPYFDVLRNKEIISKPTVFVVEPILHAVGDNKSGKEVARRIYQDQGIYFDKRGMNPNTGFIAYLGCFTPDKNDIKDQFSAGEVTNVSNWRSLFSGGGRLNPDNNRDTDLSKNLLFVEGLNMLPFGVCQKKLLELVSLQQRFKEEKALLGKSFATRVKKDPVVQASMRDKTEQLRQAMLIDVNDANAAIALELKNMFTFLTEGLL